MTIDEVRVLKEAEALNDVCNNAFYDRDEQFVALEGFPMPRGWDPSRTAIIFDLPETYPGGQPDVYFPKEQEYRGTSPMIKLDHRGPPGWSEHCINDMDDNLVPEFHSLVTFLRLINESFKKPNKRNPWA